ncbi:MAG: hypothetical protein AVDCRST_MAG67-3558 [uncultured Solirubrobacteraceae bacterium]|uniref:Uncharacterized protein n=1 Tax=uncultured Solirubrobacteraceae bacterium TaxID=1162706 RepID=A0A6J4TLF4_9ACTN|nr:MAG: hypothetical protein AVDCRST_MAG67-3558 [uncultured Solirubrobacteraceae bacterium]
MVRGHAVSAASCLKAARLLQVEHVRDSARLTAASVVFSK